MKFKARGHTDDMLETTGRVFNLECDELENIFKSHKTLEGNGVYFVRTSTRLHLKTEKFETKQQLLDSIHSFYNYLDTNNNIIELKYEDDIKAGEASFTNYSISTFRVEQTPNFLRIMDFPYFQAECNLYAQFIEHIRSY